MPAPEGFSWIEKPLLAGMARPDDLDELAWLRQQGVQLLISLSEFPPRRDLVNEAGLLLMHVPIEDLHPPTQKQIDLVLAGIAKAHAQNMGVGIHCGAGLGRTGTMLACWLVHKGASAQEAIARIRRLRPGSVETDEQSDAIHELARRLKRETS